MRYLAVILFTALTAYGAGVGAQPANADIAARISGSWQLNKELSPILAAPGPGRGGRGGGALFALAPAAFGQRGGRGGGGGGGGTEAGSPLMKEEVAAQAALTILEQVPLEITIQATASEITFTEPRGQWIYKIDGKNATIQVPGSTLKVKTKWDRDVLRQEFSSTRRVLKRSWTVNADNRLVLTQRIESLTYNTKDMQAVFDRVAR
jgi:hypothetical protein